MATSEIINHPSHYNTGEIEPIEVIEDWQLGFCLGNVIKYIARAEHKGSTIDDLRKAVWYLNREIARRTSCTVCGKQPSNEALSSAPHLLCNDCHVEAVRIG